MGLFVDCIIYFIVKEIPRKDSSIPLYSSPTSLPSIANTLVTLFYNKKTWTSLFLHLLSGKLSSKRESLKTTLACILLLHMYASGDKKANLKQLKKALISSSKKLTDLKNSINFYKESVDSSTTERNCDRKSVERNLPDKVQCSALESLSKSTETHEKTSKEEFYGNQSKQISDSIKLQSSQNNENNLEELVHL